MAECSLKTRGIWDMRVFKSSSATFATLLLGSVFTFHPAGAREGAEQLATGELASRKSLQADTPLLLPSGARFTAPKGWSLERRGSAVIVGAPEGDSHIAIVDLVADGADDAVAAAWAVYKPGFTATQQGEDRKPWEGWEKTARYQYKAPPGKPRTIMALALAKGQAWTVIIYDVSDAVGERRDAQLEVIFNSLLPKGYERESFAGRPAHRLDAARIEQLTIMIEDARTDFEIPGVALGLIQGGKVIFAGGFGVREQGGREPVDADTLFNIASVGKPLTTLMLAKQVEAGRFNWDTRVASKWPAFRLGDPETTRQVTARHLVCACTGMPRNDYGWLFEGENSTPQSVMQMLGSSTPTSPFGDTYQYSNLMASAGGFFGGYVLYPKLELGAAYDAAMQKLVFDPLGMRATTADFSKALAGNHASGHALDVDGKVQVASQGLNYASISTRPSGNHWSNVNDLLRYVRMELTKGILPNGRRYIREDLLLDRREPLATEGLNEYYGMGLKIDRQWGVPVIHHGGSQAGYRSHIIWLPDHGVGAVILTNSDLGGALRAAFRRRLLELLFDGKPIASATLTADAKTVRARAAKDRQQLTVPANREAVSTLARHYQSAELGMLQVSQIDGATWFDFGGWRSEMASRQNEDGTTTFVTISPGMAGYEFMLPDMKAEPSRLVIREAQKEYEFNAVK
jgi:CubicO group peptidase (beta-lactamase class C family)